jgi:4-hydroxy-tetrahydrodipicolinate synthase
MPALPGPAGEALVIKTQDPPFGRVITAMVTPFGDDLEIDWHSVEKVVNYLIATGTDTLLVSGTTGESPTLQHEEKLALLKAVIKHSAGRAKVIMGTGSNATIPSVQATIEAENMGADGALLVAPYYNKPSQEGLLAHFETIAKATKLPLLIYNIPGRTGVTISADTLIKLADRCENVHALKDSTGTVEHAGEIGEKARGDFRVYCGDDNLTLPFLAVGASGVVSVASHIIGRAIREMIDLFFDRDLDGARKLHYRYMPIFKALFAAPNPTCVKYALSQLGMCKPHLRLPLVPLSPSQQEALDTVLRSMEIGVKVPVGKSTGSAD